MAFRSSAITSSSTGGTVTATPAGVQAHDYLGLLFDGDNTGFTPTYPSGWTERANADLSGPDVQTARYADKNDASGSDSFTLISNTATGVAMITAAWSGRDNTNPRSTTPVTTTNTTANASAISATITGITATANDDIAVWMFTDQTIAASRWTYSTITNYTERQDGVATDWVSGIALDTRDNVSAGGTGNFSTTITDASSSTSGYGGIVVAIKLAPAGGGGNTALFQQQLDAMTGGRYMGNRVQ